MSAKRLLKIITLLSTLCVVLCLLGNHMAFAQTWQALPPYNFLWPLWSPALSPVDPVTGLNTPIVSELYPNTVLPLQPGLAWNPAFDNPYFLYNSPVGLQYYDIIYGINPWPPGYMFDPITGSPLSINLPVGYNFLPPTDTLWLQQNLPIANLAYLAEYPNLALAAYSLGLPPNLTGLNPWLASLIYPTPAFSSLLSAAQILGYIAVTSTPSLAAPPPVAPPPTVVAPPPTAIITPLTVAVPPPTVVIPPPTGVVPLATAVAPPPTVVTPPATVVTPPATPVAPVAPVVFTGPGGTIIITTPAPPGNVIILL